MGQENVHEQASLAGGEKISRELEDTETEPLAMMFAWKLLCPSGLGRRLRNTSGMSLTQKWWRL